MHAASTGGGITEALAGTMTGAYAGTQAGIAFGMAAYGQTPTPESMGIPFASAFGGALASTSLSTGYQRIAQSNTGGTAMRAASGPIEAPDGVPGSCSLGDCFAENNQGGASSVASDAGGTGASGTGAATPYVPVDSGAEQAAVLAAEVLSGEALLAWAAKGLRLVKAAWAAKAAEAGMSTRVCFPAGTKVSTPDGAKPIESLREGDEVYSFDFASGELVVSQRHCHVSECIIRDRAAVCRR